MTRRPKKLYGFSEVSLYGEGEGGGGGKDGCYNFRNMISALGFSRDMAKTYDCRGPDYDGFEDSLISYLLTGLVHLLFLKGVWSPSLHSTVLSL